MTNTKGNKGTYLELRVARLLLSQGLTPFLNVWFRSGLDFGSVSQPDIDVMGCRFLPDSTIFFAHYDCKSGDSKVVNRVLLLTGLKEHLPPGPIIYVRKRTSLDIKRYAMQSGIRITDISQIEEKEAKFVRPVFNDYFPSICDKDVHELWLSLKRSAKKEKLGRIVNYFDYEFWNEPPFTRLKRSLAAIQLMQSSFSESGVSGAKKDILLALAIRRFLFGLVSAASHISLLSNKEIDYIVRESLVTERLHPSEYQLLIESTAQLIFELYGDASKGPLKSEDYYVPPPDYTEELTNILRRTIDLNYALPISVIGFDALIIERSLRRRPQVAEAILNSFPKSHVDAFRHWLRSIKLFMSKNDQTISNWIGWKGIEDNKDPTNHST